MQRASGLLIFLMLGSLTGCAASRPEFVTVRVPPEACPRPASFTATELPALDPAPPLDSPANVEILLRRHSLLKAVVRERERALDCYEAPTR
jgi:hypothetical protein